ncbi:hypothetical protein FRC03_007052 [Tulasnella sp. 419]|nr:hypothetical protein FRC03_007052 [Tulasnella sp. 419]
MSEPTAANRTPRQLVLCFDGTGNKFGEDNTNVVKLFAMLTKNSSSLQKVYYQSGIGTYDPDGFLSSADKIIDSGMAVNMKDHILGGYKFLMQTYESGDEISIFGFSRGAVTARALAAMLYIVGLLPQDNEEHVSFAWDIFSQAHQEKGRQKDDWRRYKSLNFKRTFSREVKVQFLGLWDTVIGVAPVRMLENTNYNPIVHHVRHAIALHETRDRFQVELWGVPPAPNSEEAFRETEPAQGSKYIAPAARAGANMAGQAHLEKLGNAGLQSTHQHADQRNTATVTDVEEVWFAGFHSDVGGGNTPYYEKSALSYIPLRWMVREALQHSSIIFETSVLDIFNIKLPKDIPESGSDPVTLQKYRQTEQGDAESDLHSPYEGGVMGVFYTIAEYLPKYRSDGRGILPHRAKARDLAKPTMDRPNKIHSSVLSMLAKRAKDEAAALESLQVWGSEHVEIVDQWALDPTSKASNWL